MIFENVELSASKNFLYYFTSHTFIANKAIYLSTFHKEKQVEIINKFLYGNSILIFSFFLK